MSASPALAPDVPSVQGTPSLPAPLPSAEPQLTPRALLLGAGAGALLAACNLYVGLRTGLGMGVVLAAGPLIWGTHRLLRARSALGLLELNAAQSTASAAGFSTCSTLASAVAALVLATGSAPPGWLLGLWTLCVAVFGVCCAAPLRRTLVVEQALPFPTGTAAAAMLRTLVARTHSGVGQARALLAGTLTAGLAALGRDGLGWLPATLALPGRLAGVPLAAWSLGLDVNLLAAGAGALLGLRTALSLAVGALVCFGLLGPLLLHEGVLAEAGAGALLGWSMWPGTGLLVGASLTHLLLGGGVRAAWALVRTLGRAAPPRAEDALPRPWVLGGALLSGAGSALCAHLALGVPLWLAVGGVLLAVPLCAIGARVTGETDLTPAAPLGQVAQLAAGVVAPGALVGSLAVANVAAGSAATGADLLTDLKAGHLVGACPRRQFLSQLAGCAVGALVGVPLFLALVPGPAALAEGGLPVPAAHLFLGVARVLSEGLSALSPAARAGLAWGTGVGVGLALLERLLPARLAGRLPSPAGVGLAFLLPASLSAAFLVGALLAHAARRSPRASALAVPLASGLLVGESLVGLVLPALQALRGGGR